MVELWSQPGVLFCSTSQGTEPAKDEHIRFASFCVLLLDVYLSVAMFWMDFICNLVQINVLVCVLIYSFPFPELAERPRACNILVVTEWTLVISFMLSVILLLFPYWRLHHHYLERAVGNSLRFKCDGYRGMATVCKTVPPLCNWRHVQHHLSFHKPCPMH